MDKCKQNDKLKFEESSAVMAEGITCQFAAQFVTNWPSGLPDKLKFEKQTGKREVQKDAKILQKDVILL